jgi:hypothetical protein
MYEKDLSDFVFTDAKTRASALADAQKSSHDAELALLRLHEIKTKEDEDRKRKAEESKIEFNYDSGVSEKAAFFKRRMVVDETTLNRQKVSLLLYSLH